MRLALICDSRPALQACRRLGRQLGGAGAEVTLLLAPTLMPDQPHSPPPGGQESVLVMEPLAAAASELMGHLDAVGVFLEPGALRAFRTTHRQAARLRSRPARPLFTGPLLPLVGDALNADLLPRLGYDLICLHGEAQLEALDWLTRGSEHAAQAREAIGLWGVASEPIGRLRSQTPLLVFIEQQQVPPAPRDKALLYRRLKSIALASPGWTVRLQPDHSPPADLEQWSEASLAFQHRVDPGQPANLQLGSAADLPLSLMQAWACLGISSPWLLSAMLWNKPTAVLADYGIRTEFNGPMFFGSGLMRRLADCQPPEQLLSAPGPNPGWLADLGWAIVDGPQRLLGHLEGLVR